MTSVAGDGDGDEEEEAAVAKTRAECKEKKIAEKTARKEENAQELAVVALAEAAEAKATEVSAVTATARREHVTAVEQTNEEKVAEGHTKGEVLEAAVGTAAGDATDEKEKQETMSDAADARASRGREEGDEGAKADAKAAKKGIDSVATWLPMISGLCSSCAPSRGYCLRSLDASFSSAVGRSGASGSWSSGAAGSPSILSISAVPLRSSAWGGG